MRWSWLRSKRQEPSVQEIQRGFLRGFLFFESDLFWWNFGAEALHTVNAKTAGSIFAQPTPWRFCVGCRSCPRESSSSNCSCVGLFCAYAARLVLRERLWGEANIRRQPDSNPGTAPPACHRGVFRRALGRPANQRESRSAGSDTACFRSEWCNRLPPAGSRHG